MRFPRLCQERRASPPPWGSCRPQAFCSSFECVPAIGRRRAFLSECRAFISSLSRVPIAMSRVPIGMSRVHLKPVARSYRNVARSSQACRAFLSECRAFISSLPCVSIGMSRVHLKPVARSYCGVLRSITPAVCRLAPNRTACGILRSCSAGSRSPIVRSRDVGAVICLCGFTSGLAVSLWRSRRGCQGTRGTENGAGDAAFVPLCVVILVLKFFPRGVRWGLRAPKPAPKSLRLSGLSSFDSRCGQ